MGVNAPVCAAGSDVRPSGSLREPLDDLILSLYVRVLGGRDSDSLLLEHPGVVTILGSGAVAELLTSSTQSNESQSGNWVPRC